VIKQIKSIPSQQLPPLELKKSLKQAQHHLHIALNCFNSEVDFYSALLKDVEIRSLRSIVASLELTLEIVRYDDNSLRTEMKNIRTECSTLRQRCDELQMERKRVPVCVPSGQTGFESPMSLSSSASTSGANTPPIAAISMSVSSPASPKEEKFSNTLEPLEHQIRVLLGRKDVPAETKQALCLQLAEFKSNLEKWKSPVDKASKSVETESLSLSSITFNTQASKSGETDSLCSVCFQQKCEVLFQNCGHFVCCLKCSKDILRRDSPKCPSCRTPFRRRDLCQIHFC